jgi:hypothetical protein
MTFVPRWTRSSSGAATGPRALSATPTTTARKMICRMSPSTNGLAIVVGMMWVRKSHQCWFSPFSIRPPTVAETSIWLGSALTPRPTGSRLIASNPVVNASNVPSWK